MVRTSLGDQDTDGFGVTTLSLLTKPHICAQASIPEEWKMRHQPALPVDPALCMCLGSGVSFFWLAVHINEKEAVSWLQQEKYELWSILTTL